MQTLVECVPNFSEGRDPEVIHEIVRAIRSVDQVRVLHVDSGYAANRTVVTFVGPVEAVVEAAYRMVVRAADLIDMRTQTGEHPRIGATDVCPLIPLSDITMGELVEYVHRLAERIATEGRVPTYCYELAALKLERRKLAVCRKGEYEGLAARFGDEDEMPDFGGEEWTESAARSGATVIGARKFLIAINYNLNTTEVSLAADIAADVRESGRMVVDERGERVRRAGTLRKCAAIGWYIEEFGIAQVSMNITDMDVTPIHVAYEEVVRQAAQRGLEVTGVEIIGLVPKRALLEAGQYFWQKCRGAASATEQELLRQAIISLGLDDLAPFDPQHKIIEYSLDNYTY